MLTQDSSAIKNTFCKAERLCHKQLIDNTFKGNNYWLYPFKVFWNETPLKSRFPVQVLISVPKKKFKDAVSRNKIKRQIREIYRKNKSIIYNPLISLEKQLAIGISYQSNKMLDFAEMEVKLIGVLTKIAENVQVTN